MDSGLTGKMSSCCLYLVNKGADIHRKLTELM